MQDPDSSISSPTRTLRPHCVGCGSIIHAAFDNGDGQLRQIQDLPAQGNKYSCATDSGTHLQRDLTDSGTWF